jgi:acetoin utilization deacetylase AcuC-like enzyme
MITGIVTDPRYLDHNRGAGHIEGPERLEAVYEMIAAGLPFPYEHIEPRAASREEIEYVHAHEYVDFLSLTAGRPYVSLDPDTSMTARSFDCALLAAGGAMKAADMIMEGRIRNGFALVRPPGHHAETNHAQGFCIFNNIAIVAEHLLRNHGLRRILIADWDVHHGNGTQNSFFLRRDVLFFSTHRYPFYPGSGYWPEIGAGEGEGFTVNVPLTAGKGDEDYVFIYRNVLEPIAAAYQPDFILVSAGFDIDRDDPLGGMNVTSAGFGALAAELLIMAEKSCRGRILFVLEGGYGLEGLAEGVKQVLLRLSGTGTPLSVKALISEAVRNEIAPVFEIHRKYWPLKMPS